MAERVTIERLGSAGDGVATVEGRPVFVPDALPGEVVEVDREGGGRARALSRVVSSPDRAEPFCPYYGRCGGCVAQHMAPPLYAAWKRDKAVAALAGAGLAGEGLAAPVDDLVDAHGAGRRRMVLHARDVDGARRVGFMAARSHDLVPIAECPITTRGLGQNAVAAAGELATLLAGIAKPLDLAVTATDAGLDIDLRGSGPLSERRRQGLIAAAPALGIARLSLHGETLVEARKPVLAIGSATLALPPGGFLQPTREGEEVLAGLALAGVAGAKRVADLFAGSGGFTLRLARSAEIHAVEADAAALAALDVAWRGATGLRRVTTERRDLFRRPLLGPELARFDAVVLDPPRAGADAQARQLAAAAVPTVIMVSCDPGTFARDAAVLVGGGYALERVVPVDQFKWSAHLEVVGTFRRTVDRGRRGRR